MNIYKNTKKLRALPGFEFKHFLTVWILAMPLAAPTVAADAPFARSWTTIVKELGKAPGAGTPPFTHAIKDDLLEVNKQELKEIDGAWLKQPSLAKTPAEKRLAKNQFFHEQVAQRNQELIAKLEKDAAANLGTKIDYSATARDVLKQVAANPVANLEAVNNYPDGGQIGFCFGRALLVHYYLLKAGVKREDTIKMFNIGDLMVNGQLWHFHVTVLVRDSKQGFLAVDPLATDVMDYKTWIKENTAYDIKRDLSRARFYTTDPRKFLVGPGMYSLENLQMPHLKKYFTDLGKTLTK